MRKVPAAENASTCVCVGVAVWALRTSCLSARAYTESANCLTHGKVGGWVHESGGGLGRLESLDELREDALGAALGRRGHALLHRVQSTWRDIASCRVMCGQGGGEFRGGGGRGGRYGDGGIDDGMPRHIGIVPPGARLTVIGHERVVRLDLVRALDERRDLTRRAARRTRGHHRAPMGPVR